MSKRLDSRALALFLAVTETRSFRQAAHSLHLSQPPLSRAIRELEERLGARLFVRGPGGASLTEAGQRLLPLARKVDRLLCEGEALFASGPGVGVLRLGLTSALELPWFADLPQALREARPALDVQISTDSSPRLMRRLLAGRLDAAVVATPCEARNAHLTPLARLPLLVALPANHPLARKRRLGLADLGRETLFWFERARQPAFFDHCRGVFDRHGFAPALRQEPPDHHVLLSSIAAGQGVALLPQSFAALRRSGVVYRPLREGDELAVGVALATPGAGWAQDLLLSVMPRSSRPAAGVAPA